MFDQVKIGPDRRRARRGAFVAFSAVIQALIVLALVVAGNRLRAAVTGREPVVDVKFFKVAPSVPPPAPAAPKRSRPVHARTEPRRTPPPPSALIQPKMVAPVPEPAPPSEPPEEEPGVEGGIVGGVPNGAADGYRDQGAVSDAPTFPKPGYRLPRLAVGTCLQSSLDLSKELQRTLAGAITAKFAILGNGTPAYFQVLTQVADRRISEAIWKAVAGCQWVPGADASGQPVSIWVVVPFRFQSG